MLKILIRFDLSLVLELWNLKNFLSHKLYDWTYLEEKLSFWVKSVLFEELSLHQYTSKEFFSTNLRFAEN